MDPLSITATAITLIQAASAVTASLRRLVHVFKTADSRITELCNELASLTTFLEAVQRTLKGCQPLDLAFVEDDMWRRSELSLVDCQVTLNELGVLVNKIKDNASARGFGWRVRATVDLSVYNADIATFRDKLHKSNWALQTMLHTVTVSLSLRSNASQEMILFELDRLKSSIDEALQASLRPAPGFSPNLASDSRVARNLRKLAEAAKHFHSSASSTASTVRDGSMARWKVHIGNGTNSSLMGDFPADRRERVEMFIRDAHRHTSGGQQTPVRAASPPPDSIRSPRPASIAAPQPLRVAIPDPPTGINMEEDDEDDEEEFEKLFLDGLEDLAKDSIRSKDFEKAIELLKEAIRREEKTSTDKEDFRRLQSQLALCYFFMNDWKQAEPIVSSLARSAKTNSDLDPVVWTMLHALALAHLSDFKFDSALQTCKKALQGKKRWAKANGSTELDTRSCAETAGLLATIFHTKGDYIAAEIYRRQQPDAFIYEHSSDPREFLSGQRDQLSTVLGDDLPDFCESLAPVKEVPGFHELYGNLPPPTQAPIQRLPTMRRSRTISGGDLSPLRTRRHEWEKFESDTSKEVIVCMPGVIDEETDADDEASSSGSSSPVDTAERSGLARKPTRIPRLTRNRARSPAEEEEADSSEPNAAASPTKRWFRRGNLFAVKASREVLRKQPESDGAKRLLRWKRRRTFRVLNLDDRDSSLPSELRTMGNQDRNVSMPELADGSQNNRPSLPTIFSDGDADNFVVRNGVLYADTSRSAASSTIQRTKQVSELPGLPATSLVVCELDGPPISRSSERVRGQDAAVDMLRYFSLLPPSSSSHESTDTSGMSYLAFPTHDEYSEITAWEARALGGDGHDKTASDEPVSPVTETSSCLHTIEDTSDQQDRGCEEQNAPEKVEASADQNQDWSLQDPLSPVSHRAAHMDRRPDPVQGSLSSEAEATLSWVAGIMSTLPSRKSWTEKTLNTAIFELKQARASLEKFGADPVLCHDIQRVTKTLETTRTDMLRLREAQDSGYESIGQGSGADSVKSDVCSPRSTQVLGQATSPLLQRRDAIKPRTPALQRQFSCIAGDEAACTPHSKSGLSVPGRRNRHGPVASPRKQVKWALSKEGGNDAGGNRRQGAREGSGAQAMEKRTPDAVAAGGS